MKDEPSLAIEERALIQARLGVGAGFEVLFNALAGPISAFAARRGSDDPDGVANTALFDAYKGLANFEGDFSAFRAYVFRIARNRIIDDFRKRERRPKLAVLDDVPAALVIEDTAELMGSQQWVSQLLGELTEDQREVITLRILGDVSIAETALIMGKPITAVKALQRRAIRRLHALTGAEVHR